MITSPCLDLSWEAVVLLRRLLEDYGWRCEQLDPDAYAELLDVLEMAPCPW